MSGLTTYLSSIVSGVWDAVVNTGFFKSLLLHIGNNIISQIINMIKYKKQFSTLAVFVSIIDFSISYVIGEKLKIKSPKFIRDIKAKARSLGIKGTRQLTQFLNQRIFKINLANITISNVRAIIKSSLQGVLNGYLNKQGIKIYA